MMPLDIFEHIEYVLGVDLYCIAIGDFTTRCSSEGTLICRCEIYMYEKILPRFDVIELSQVEQEFDDVWSVLSCLIAYCVCVCV